MKINDKAKKYISLLILIVFCMMTIMPTYAQSKDSEVNQPTDQILQEIKELVREKYLYTIPEDILTNLTYQELMTELDQYCSYYEKTLKEDTVTLLNKEYIGVGIELIKQEQDFFVKQVIINSPAQETQVINGDRILSVDGTSLEDKTLDEALQLFRGDLGEVLVLKLSRRDYVYEVALERSIIKKEVIDSKIITVQDDKLLYVDFDSFYKGVSNEMYQLLRDTFHDKPNITQLVIDLRGNKGGLLSEALKMSKFLVPKGAVLHVEKPSKKYMSYYSSLTTSHYKCVVLVDRHTASASEILASAIKESGVGLVVGEKTFGKGVIQKVYRLSDGSYFKLTTNRFVSRDFTDFNEVGIEPDVKIGYLTPIDFEQLQEIFESIK